MMKKYYYNILASLLLLMTAACSVEDFGDRNAFGRKGTPIRLTAGTVANDQMRAATDIQNTLFDTGERLNVYIWSGAIGSETWVGNPTLCTTEEANAGKNVLTPDVGMEPSYPEDGSHISLYGLYPQTATRGITAFSVLEDQKSDGNYKLSDLMWGGKNDGSIYSDLSASIEPIDLYFKHKMAKIIVTVTSDGAGTVTNVALKNIFRSIGFTPVTGVLGDNETLSLKGDVVLSNDGTANACLFPPQAVLGEFLEIETDAGDGSTAVIALATPKTFESGKVYHLNVTINELNLLQVVTIPEWGDVQTLNVEALDGSNFSIDDIPNIQYDGAHEYTLTQDGDNPQLVVRMNGNVVDKDNYTVQYFNNTAVGYAVVLVQGKGELSKKNAAKTFYIEAAKAVVTTVPDGLGESSYTGSAQPLCSVGSAVIENTTTPVTIKYSLNKTGPYTTDIPTSAEVGTYYVWYKVDPTENYGGVAAQRVEHPTIINLASTPTPTAPTANSLTYNEKPQALVTEGVTTVGRMVYSLSQTGVYTTDIPTGTNAGTYTVWWKVDGGGKYEDTTPQSIDVTIQKANGRVTLDQTSIIFKGSERINTIKTITIDHAGTGTLSYEITSDPGVDVTLTDNKLNLKRITDGKRTGKTITISDPGDNNYLAAQAQCALTINQVVIKLSEVKATDAKYLGYMVADDGYIYPNTNEGFEMMASDHGITVSYYNGVPSCLRGVITYIGSDAVGQDENGNRTAGGHGYVLANDHAGSCKWADNPKATATNWNNSHQVVEDEGEASEKKYWWYLGTKEDYQKAVIANDVINKEWLFPPILSYYGTCENFHFWSWNKFTSTESGSSVWCMIPHHSENAPSSVTLEKRAKKSTLLGVDITIDTGILQLFAF